MFLRVGLQVIFLATLGNCVDHTIFKNCSQVEFCNELRNYEPDKSEQYIANLSSVNIDDGTARITIQNGNDNTLQVQIIALTDGRFRLIIEEEESTRYRLNVVLDGEPPKTSFNYVSSDGGQIKISETETSQNFVMIQGAPYEIWFYNNDNALLRIRNLVMQQKEDSSPFALISSFPNALQLYGIHEHADILALRNTLENGSDPYRLRNSDVSGHEAFSPMSIYGAVPVLYGHGHVTAGIFLHNAAEQWYDISNSEDGSWAHIMAQSGLLDMFILMGTTPKDVVRQYTGLTGKAHMPQLWALGYHQSRWNYENQSDVKDVVANFDMNEFPLDAIWLDIEYTDGKKYFTWNPDTFSDPVEMQQNLSSTGRKLVTIIDPHIKVDENYNVYKGALEKDLFAKNPNGTNFEGNCWPGISSYMDFLNPEARSYYASMYHYDNFKYSTETLGGIWNDMNEPSVFDNSNEISMPGDVQHKDADGTIVHHRDIHNIYGLLHTMSTHQGLLERDDNTKRPFILTRSHFAGSQRYAAFWTGDNDALWSHLKISYSQCMNSNLLGLVFCGADIGGFANNPSEELLQRWYQAATWTPFYRSHATTGLPRREPYLFSDEVQEVIRNTMNLRYKHLPLWYTLFFEHTRTGDPILRPLFYQYPNDLNVLTIDDQLFVGDNVMVRAVNEPEVTSVNIYFPEGVWYSIHTNDIIQGPISQDIAVNISSIPIYYRGGGIIPRKEKIRRSTQEMTDDCYTLFINLDTDKSAVGSLYVDDLTSFKYRDEQDFNYVLLDYFDNERRLNITPILQGSKGAYDITVCKIVINRVPTNATKYVTEEYNMNSEKKLLSSFRIPLNQATSLNLGM